MIMLQSVDLKLEGNPQGRYFCVLTLLTSSSNISVPELVKKIIKSVVQLEAYCLSSAGYQAAFGTCTGQAAPGTISQDQVFRFMDAGTGSFIFSAEGPCL